MANILFITSNRVGDAVLSTAVLEHAMASLEGAAVTIACGPLPAPLFRAVPNLQSIEPLGKEKGRWLRLWRKLSGTRFDLAIDLRGSLTTLFLPVKRRVIYRKARVLQHKLDELSALVHAREPLEPRIRIDAQAEADAAAILGGADSVLAFGPGANFVGKIWPAERFVATATALAGPGGRLAGFPVVLLGSEADRPICARIASDLAAAGLPGVVNAAGRLDLLACAAVQRRAALFVGNDSGLMHMAAAIGAPTIGLFGPSDERVYGPRGPRTRAVRSPRSFEEILSVGPMPSITYSLMEDLPTAKVLAVCDELLNAGGLA